jgi:homoserine dehydrogenase
VGFGVVGQGFAELIMTKHEYLKQYYGVDLSLVGVANARHGFIYQRDGLNIPAIIQLVREKLPLDACSNSE